MGGDAFASAGKAKALLGGGLDADAAHLCSHGPGQPLPHLWDVRGQLRLLGQDGGVYIIHRIAVFG